VGQPGRFSAEPNLVRVVSVQTTRPNLVNTLKTAGSDTPGGKRLFGRNSLVVGQVAGSMVLWFVTAAMSHGFRSALTEGPGFRTDHLR